MDVASRLGELAALYELPDGAVVRLAALLELVAASGVSLTAVRELERAVDVHVADSLTGLLVPAVREAASIADLGSGGGFPGLVLAVARPDAAVTLVESVGKKAAFLGGAAGQLGLANVAVVERRAEDWESGLGTQDVVTARALAPLGALVEYAAPLLRHGGSLIAWKGPAAVGEEPDAAAAASILGMSSPERVPVRASIAPEERYLYVSSKVRSTPPGYPRRAGMARKRPIRA